MCYSDWTDYWTWVSPNRKEAISLISAQFYHYARKIRKGSRRLHSAKVKGHAELKIEKPRVKTLIYDFPKLHHSSPNSFDANVHLRHFKKKTVKVIKGHLTSHQSQKYKNRRGAQGPPVPQIWCNYDHYLRSYGILKKMARTIFLDWPPSWKC